MLQTASLMSSFVDLVVINKFTPIKVGNLNPTYLRQFAINWGYIKIGPRPIDPNNTLWLSNSTEL